jgi:hypothetical protein
MKVKSLYGEIELNRSYYVCRKCGYTEIPLDEVLEITNLAYRMTTHCQMEAAYWRQNQCSFREASEVIEKTMGMVINEETLRQVSEAVGKSIFEKDTQRSRNALEAAHFLEPAAIPKKKTLYIMTDGASVNTRVEDKDGSTWRENKTVMVFTDKDMIRRKDGTHIITRKEYAAFIGSAESFRKYVWDIAVRNGYGQVENIVLIADGAAWIRNMCQELFPDAVQILDLFHLKENVYDYAKNKFNQNPSQYVPWAEDVNAKLENGCVDDVIASLPMDEKLPSRVVNLRTYLENNRDKVNYPAYKSKGFFVGSGAIESANKTIVQRRLRQAGMRWSVDGAQSILTLRAKFESGLWKKEAAWFFNEAPLNRTA